MRSSRHLIVMTLALATLGAGCAKVQARTEPEMPLLAPPPPPPRIVETYVDEPLPTIEPSPAETALATPPRTPAKPPATRTDAAPKPEPPRTEPERPAAAPPPPALTLKPAPGGENKTDSSIRDLLGHAAKDLNRVDYTALNADGRAQYETARRFMQQAEEALKGGNVVFAGKLADKAATMAAVLVR